MSNYALVRLRTSKKHVIFHNTQGNFKEDDIVYCPTSQNFELIIEGYPTDRGIISRCAYCAIELD